jgi:Glucose / Sorbosone dehydrogenase
MTGEAMGKRDAAAIARWEAEHGLGSAWGNETDRAAVLVFDPAGRNRRVFASGLRNCVGLAVHPLTGDLWCSTNERDDLGDDLVPDFITRVRDGAFYGWPWYYLGANEDPRHRGERLDLKDKITIPDVLIQAHSASMGMIIYDGDQFPSEYSADAFAAQHGSWNRGKRTGYKVIRARLKDGMPTGEYEDFMTGFVVNDSSVWARPVGVAVAHDGALLVTKTETARCGESPIAAAHRAAAHRKELHPLIESHPPLFPDHPINNTAAADHRAGHGFHWNEETNDDCQSVVTFRLDQNGRAGISVGHQPLIPSFCTSQFGR